MGGSLLFLLSLRNGPVECHDSKRSGHDFYVELLKTQNRTRFQNCLRMPQPIFRLLLKVLKRSGRLSNNAKRVTVTGRSVKICAGEKLAIFLYTLTASSNSQTNEAWQHSAATISKIVHDVVEERSQRKCGRIIRSICILN